MPKVLKYQMDWIMNPKNGAWTRACMEPVASVEVIDTYTVKFHFKSPGPGSRGHVQCSRVCHLRQGPEG